VVPMGEGLLSLLKISMRCPRSTLSHRGDTPQRGVTLLCGWWRLAGGLATEPHVGDSMNWHDYLGPPATSTVQDSCRTAGQTTSCRQLT